MTESFYRIAVDIGGTFTDGVLEEPDTGKIWVAKALTTPKDPGEAVSKVIGDLLASLGASIADSNVLTVVHGTTLVTNSLIERKGAKTALLLTEGTRDIIDIGREVRYDLYDLALELPKPLVPPDARLEVAERLGADGTVRHPLEVNTIEASLDWLEKNRFEAVAVCLLHSYINDAHEKMLTDAIKARFPNLSISPSCETACEIREYERMSTTVANAYVQPLMKSYLAKIDDRLKNLDISAPLRIMLSSGGFTSAGAAMETPILLLESGPAGGVLSAANAGRQTGFKDVLTFDMGGTTAKACLVKNGAPSLVHSFETARVHRFKRGSGFPMLLPSIDLIEIGAGGGSIATTSALGLLTVGPESSGAEPGPACYGRSGRHATVTDADLLLGYLDPQNFLGGEMPLYIERAESAVGSLAEKLGMDLIQTAWGIHDVVNENMAAAARVHIAEKGHDPRSFTLVATGGAGPVHAVEVARKLGIRRILCPIAAGTGSCLGLLAAPARVDRSWSGPCKLPEIEWKTISDELNRLWVNAKEELHSAGAEDQSIQWNIEIEMRYAGQDDTVNVKIPYQSVSAHLEPILASEFENRYKHFYGRTVPKAEIQVVTWRLTGQTSAGVRHFSWAVPWSGGVGSVRKRPIYIGMKSRFSEVAVFDRYGLEPGTEHRGPVVIEEKESTLVVAVSAKVRVLPDYNILVELES